MQPESSSDTSMSQSNGEPSQERNKIADYGKPMGLRRVDRLLAALPTHSLTADMLESIVPSHHVVDQPSGGPSGGSAIFRCMRQLELLEGEARKTSIRTNVAYWQLGQAAYSGVRVSPKYGQSDHPG